MIYTDCRWEGGDAEACGNVGKERNAQSGRTTCTKALINSNDRKEAIESCAL